MNNIRIIHIHKASEESNSFVEYATDIKVQMLRVPNFVRRYGDELIEDYKSKCSTSKNKNGIKIMRNAS